MKTRKELLWLGITCLTAQVVIALLMIILVNAGRLIGIKIGMYGFTIVWLIYGFGYLVLKDSKDKRKE